MDFKQVEQIAREANLSIEEGFKQLSIQVNQVDPNAVGLNKDDYNRMMKEFERVKKLKQQLDGRNG